MSDIYAVTYKGCVPPAQYVAVQGWKYSRVISVISVRRDIDVNTRQVDRVRTAAEGNRSSGPRVGVQAEPSDVEPFGVAFDAAALHFDLEPVERRFDPQVRAVGQYRRSEGSHHRSPNVVILSTKINFQREGNGARGISVDSFKLTIVIEKSYMDTSSPVYICFKGVIWSVLN